MKPFCRFTVSLAELRVQEVPFVLRPNGKPSKKSRLPSVVSAFLKLLAANIVDRLSQTGRKEKQRELLAPIEHAALPSAACMAGASGSTGP